MNDTYISIIGNPSNDNKKNNNYSLVQWVFISPILFMKNINRILQETEDYRLNIILKKQPMNIYLNL